MRFIVPFLLAISVSAKSVNLPHSSLSSWSGRGRAATKKTSSLSKVSHQTTNKQYGIKNHHQLITVNDDVLRGGGGSVSSGSPLKLLIGVGGIYGAFMKYGLLQEAVFKYKSNDGTKFDQVWFLMVLEALANVIVGFIGIS